MSQAQAISAAAAGTITLGGDLTVNRLGYGAMRITGKGIWGPPADKPAALATLRRAVELGVNFIDTADSYGPYVSEELIAEALFPYAAGVVVATKGGWDRCGPGQWLHNASPKHLTEAVEGSLKRLRLERIDVYQLHVPDPAVSYDASMETLATLREQGKIRHVALSNVTQEHIERGRKIVPIVSVQNRYSFADREWDYVVRYCEQHGIAFLPWAPWGRTESAGDSGEGGEGTWSHHAADRAGMAAQAVQNNFADSGNFVGCSFGRECRRGWIGASGCGFQGAVERQSPARQLSRLEHEDLSHRHHTWRWNRQGGCARWTAGAGGVGGGSLPFRAFEL